MRVIRLLLSITIILFLLAPMETSAAPRLQDAGEKLVIVIDPGHGGENLGTIENNHIEKDMTLITALAMYEELAQYDNVEVYLTRTQDRDMTLKERAEYAEAVEADFLFSIHYNASENHELFGSEVWVPLEPPYNNYGYQFGYELLQDMKDLGLLVRGVKTRRGDKGLDYYGILRESVARDIPAVIIEHCHVDEARDAVFCDNEEKLKNFGKMDATAVAKYFGLKSVSQEVDFSGYSLAEINAESSVSFTLRPDTAPEVCEITFVDADYEAGKLTLSVSASDKASALLYYSYSIDGGASYGARESWPGSDPLTGNYERDFTLTLDIPPGVCPEVIVRAYNVFDLCTESNHYESPWVFPYPPEETETEEMTAADDGEEHLVETNAKALLQDLDVVIAVVLFTIAILLTMVLIAQIASSKKRRRHKKGCQRRNVEGRSRNHPR